MVARQKNPVWAGLAAPWTMFGASLGLLWLVMLGLSGPAWAGPATHPASASEPPAALHIQGVISPTSIFALQPRGR